MRDKEDLSVIMCSWVCEEFIKKKKKIEAKPICWVRNKARQWHCTESEWKKETLKSLNQPLSLLLCHSERKRGTNEILMPYLFWDLHSSFLSPSLPGTSLYVKCESCCSEWLGCMFLMRRPLCWMSHFSTCFAIQRCEQERRCCARFWTGGNGTEEGRLLGLTRRRVRIKWESEQ